MCLINLIFINLYMQRTWNMTEDKKKELFLIEKSS